MNISASLRWLPLMCLAAFAAAAAAAYPEKPIRMIMPNAPGAAKLGEVMGQQIVINNRPGAGGTIPPRASASRRI